MIVSDIEKFILVTLGSDGSAICWFFGVVEQMLRCWDVVWN